jgi:cell division septal protein FtsQ
LPNSEKIDFPIINDPYTKSEIVEFSEAQKNNDVKIGLKIITAIKIINPKLYESLSEVNLRAGKDIILQFSTLDIPVVLGRNNEIEKIILFEKLLQKLDYSQIENTLSYIDLRYSQYLYVGKSIDSNTEQESNS